MSNTIEEPLQERISSNTRSQPKAGTETAHARGTFWNQQRTVINFWLDVALLALFMAVAWMLTVVATVFPRGADKTWTVWGATKTDWFDGAFATFWVFGLAVLVHVMLHWNWICATIATRLLGRKASKDDGTQTLLGVGFLVGLVHLLAAGVLAARVALQHHRPG